MTIQNGFMKPQLLSTLLRNLKSYLLAILYFLYFLEVLGVKHATLFFPVNQTPIC